MINIPEMQCYGRDHLSSCISHLESVDADYQKHLSKAKFYFPFNFSVPFFVTYELVRRYKAAKRLGMGARYSYLYPCQYFGHRLSQRPKLQAND